MAAGDEAAGLDVVLGVKGMSHEAILDSEAG
jgi:hypothetical protein